MKTTLMVVERNGDDEYVRIVECTDGLLKSYQENTDLTIGRRPYHLENVAEEFDIYGKYFAPEPYGKSMIFPFLDTDRNILWTALHILKFFEHKDHYLSGYAFNKILFAREQTSKPGDIEQLERDLRDNKNLSRLVLVVTNEDVPKAIEFLTKRMNNRYGSDNHPEPTLKLAAFVQALASNEDGILPEGMKQAAEFAEQIQPLIAGMDNVQIVAADESSLFGAMEVRKILGLKNWEERTPIHRKLDYMGSIPDKIKFDFVVKEYGNADAVIVFSERAYNNEQPDVISLSDRYLLHLTASTAHHNQASGLIWSAIPRPPVIQQSVNTITEVLEKYKGVGNN